MTLRDLLERVERSTGPDRELDAHIAIKAAGMTPTAVYGHELLGNLHTAPSRFPAYTSSVDAALALIGRVLPGAEGFVEFGKRPVAVLFIDGDDGQTSTVGRAPTPALALCAALLAAMIEQEGA